MDKNIFRWFIMNRCDVVWCTGMSHIHHPQLPRAPHTALTFARLMLSSYLIACRHENGNGTAPSLLSEWLAITGVTTLAMEQLQNLIFQEMLYFHPEAINLQWGAAKP